MNSFHLSARSIPIFIESLHSNPWPYTQERPPHPSRRSFEAAQAPQATLRKEGRWQITWFTSDWPHSLKINLGKNFGQILLTLFHSSSIYTIITINLPWENLYPFLLFSWTGLIQVWSRNINLIEAFEGTHDMCLSLFRAPLRFLINSSSVSQF